MIEQLYIENAALIEKQELAFGAGLNVLSGETGAGKTMVIDSINFLLGERGNRDFIRSSAEQATVTGVIRLHTPPPTVEAYLSDDVLLLSRSINTQGKTTCRIDGKPVTLGMLREVSAFVADVHGQHEHQSLLDPAQQLMLLDRFCGAALETARTRLGEHIRRYKELSRALTELAGNSDRESQLELLRYQKAEIDAARLKPDEEDALLRRRAVLTAAEKLSDSAAAALEALYDGEAPALDAVFRAKSAAEQIALRDTSQLALADGLAEAYTLLDDLARDLRRYYEQLEHDPRELVDLEARLDLIYTLKRKYARQAFGARQALSARQTLTSRAVSADGTVEDILAYGREVTEKLEFFENSAEDVKRLIREKRECTNEILSVCEGMSQLRQTAAQEICRQITDVLHELGMRHAEFTIAIERKKAFSANGYDQAEFLISPNPGEGVKPLARIASGGEMSRIMLAIKTVLADADHIETFIFDEIDAGVSGRTAQKVAEKLAFLARNHQILCITHLPQIAAMADRHFLIEKHSDGARTTTSVTELDDAAAVSELARLLGGAKITEATVKAAHEMRELAKQWKSTPLLPPRTGGAT